MTKQEARKTVRELVRKIGPDFSPDTDGDEYIDRRTGRPAFTPLQSVEINRSLQQAHEVIGEEVYDVAEREMKKLKLK